MLNPEQELDFRSSALPGGTLFASTYDRTYMQLADRGRASNMVGDRWADLCAEMLAETLAPCGNLRALDTELVAERVIRLDDVPEVARRASQAKLQNPDFLLVSADGQTMWAADAKFSVDTARSKQVSADATTALIALGVPTLDRELAGVVPESIRDGVFLSPDYSLTHRLLRDRRGPRRTTIKEYEVRLFAVTPSRFLETLGLDQLQSFLAAIDDLPMERGESLMFALYIYRLARAAVGCRVDQVRPLLALNDSPVVTDDDLVEQAERLSTVRSSAWGLVQRWNAEADTVRQQRLQVDQAIGPRINGRELRERVDRAAAAGGVKSPSANIVRRKLGHWFRDRVRQEFGPIDPPVVDIDSVCQALSRFAAGLYPELEREEHRLLNELLTR